uniref:Uncharacterized protein n=1 Tax=Megaselia scalaris TaxID=36166 RepID=T1GC84_MEGSC
MNVWYITNVIQKDQCTELVHIDSCFLKIHWIFRTYLNDLQYQKTFINRDPSNAFLISSLL